MPFVRFAALKMFVGTSPETGMPPLPGMVHLPERRNAREERVRRV
jgi:hypothetical protein